MSHGHPDGLPQEVPTLHLSQQVILSYKDKASMSQHAELARHPYWWGNQVKPRDLIPAWSMKSCSHPGECCLQTGTPGHTHVLAHGAGFGFKRRNGTGRIRGHYSVHHMGTRAWTSLGTLLCVTTGGQDVDRTWTSVWTLLCPPRGRTWTSLGSLSNLPALCNRRNS